jgi:hypothetical protein
MSDEMMFMIAMNNLKVVDFILIMLGAELAASPLLLTTFCLLGTTLLRSLKQTRHLTLVLLKLHHGKTWIQSYIKGYHEQYSRHV